MKKRQRVSKRVWLLLVVAVILLVVGGRLTWQAWSRWYQVPGDYLLRVWHNQADRDGPNVSYYLYADKVIEEVETFSPRGNARSVTVYPGVGVAQEKVDEILAEMIAYSKRASCGQPEQSSVFGDVAPGFYEIKNMVDGEKGWLVASY